MPIETLLVDDHLLVLETLKDMMERRGFRVSTATSGSDAIDLLTTRSFDVVFTDMRMETSTAGFEVVKAAKAQQDPPIVMILTAFPMPTASWRSSGADGFVIKGEDFGRVLQNVKRMLQGLRRA